MKRLVRAPCVSVASKSGARPPESSRMCNERRTAKCGAQTASAAHCHECSPLDQHGAGIVVQQRGQCGSCHFCTFCRLRSAIRIARTKSSSRALHYVSFTNVSTRAIDTHRGRDRFEKQNCCRAPAGLTTTFERGSVRSDPYTEVRSQPLSQAEHGLEAGLLRTGAKSRTLWGCRMRAVACCARSE